MDLRIEMYVSSDMVINFLKLYLNLHNGKFKKGDFENYMRIQLNLFGSEDESQFGEAFYERDFSHVEEKANEIYEKHYLKYYLR